jgi:Endonuclease/Exonuclease/phosphatase family.
MAFHRKDLSELLVYTTLPHNHYYCQQLYKKLQQTINEAIHLDWHIIIAGDFNAVPNPQLDKQSTTRKHHSCNPPTNVSHFYKTTA